jgi:aerotaxis receptor
VGVSGALHLAAALGTGVAATFSGPAVWAPLAAGLFLVAHATGRRLASRALQRVLDDVLSLAAGDLSHEVRVSEPGRLGELQLALAQLAANLRTVIGDVRAEVENVRGAVAEIAAGNQDLSSRTEAQAASLEQTAASMEQINGTVRQSAASATQGARLAAQTTEVAQRSHEGVLGVVQAMDGINESAARVGDIIHVIESVAFQTNILALNAAVEAARAGEAGRGFAVVAAEVRTLAHRTTESARQIKQLIAESTERAAAGARLTQEAQERMREALQSVDSVNAVLGEISTAATEQQSGVAQVNEAVTHMDGVTQQNAAMVEQMSAATQSLNAQIQQIVGVMRLLRLRPGEATAADVDAAALRREAKGDRGEGGQAAFDLQGAIAKHMEWKTKLRNAVMRGESLDSAEISRDDCCPLGQWLHGAGRSQWGHHPAFTTLLDQHAGFHREAGRVAGIVNAGRKDEVERQLAGGTPFAQATQATVMAIKRLQQERPPATPVAAAKAAKAAVGKQAVRAGADDWATF